MKLLITVLLILTSTQVMADEQREYFLAGTTSYQGNIEVFSKKVQCGGQDLKLVALADLSHGAYCTTMLNPNGTCSVSALFRHNNTGTATQADTDADGKVTWTVPTQYAGAQPTISCSLVIE